MSFSMEGVIFCEKEDIQIICLKTGKFEATILLLIMKFEPPDCTFMTLNNKFL